MQTADEFIRDATHPSEPGLSYDMSGFDALAPEDRRRVIDWMVGRIRSDDTRAAFALAQAAPAEAEKVLTAKAPFGIQMTWAWMEACQTPPAVPDWLDRLPVPQSPWAQTFLERLADVSAYPTVRAYLRRCLAESSVHEIRAAAFDGAMIRPRPEANHPIHPLSLVRMLLRNRSLSRSHQEEVRRQALEIVDLSSPRLDTALLHWMDGVTLDNLLVLVRRPDSTDTWRTHASERMALRVHAVHHLTEGRTHWQFPYDVLEQAGDRRHGERLATQAHPRVRALREKLLQRDPQDDGVPLIGW